ncbi:MAG TPA: histidine kinase dimerization/phosphoacceptor domain -containing protein [Spirochaetota bacterium]|nr:histidine kinase dimerization/phosphoacceptor domain -containing protein [Spirochaetota bacterium]
MNFFSLLSFFAFSVYLSLAFFSFLLSRKSKQNISFSLISICFAIWSFCYAFIYLTEDKNIFWILYKIGSVGWIFGFSAIFYFLIFVSKNEKIVSCFFTNVVVVIIPIIFFTVLLFDNFFIKDAFKANSFWIEIQNINSVWYSFYFIYITVIIFVGLLSIRRRIRLTKMRIERHKLRFILFGTLLNFLLCNVSNILLTNFKFPPLAHIISVSWWMATFFAIQKYNLLKNYSSELADEITEKILDYLIIIDVEKNILKINNRVMEELNYKKEDLVNKNIYELIDKNEIIEDFFTKIENKIIRKFSCEVIFRDKAGNNNFVNLNGSSISNKYDDIMCVVLVGNDSSYVREMEAQLILKEKSFEELAKNLTQKEILLKKIHHRIINNLNIIISIVGLQIEYSDDQSVKNVLRITNNRIYTISYIYEYLYMMGKIDEVSFGDFIKNLVINIFNMNNSKYAIKFNFDISRDIILNIDTAIPLGLIVNELFNNSLKYAFSNNDKENEVYINLVRVENEEYKIIYKDNGIGLPREFCNINEVKTLGLKLVKVLVEQLGGSVKIDVCDKTEFEIFFKSVVK